MQNTFDTLDAVHWDYIGSLTEEADWVENEQWFREIESAYISSVKSARMWLSVKEPPMTPKPDSVKPDLKPDSSSCSPQATVHPSNDADAVSNLVTLLNLPKVEIDCFDGNPRDYQSFISTFDEMIDSVLDDGQLKLVRLLQYTTGVAKSAIRNCTLVGGDLGYKRARDILKSRFGNVHLITQSIVSDLKSGNKVSKPMELQQLADDLSVASTALGKLGKMSEVNTQQMIVDILERCPIYVRNKWRRKALDYKRDHDAYPEFNDFVHFMQNISLDACDPVYGSNLNGTSSMKGVSYHTVTQQDPTSSCIVCKQDHSLYRCDTFRGMSPRARRDFAFQNKLCFNCLQAGHRYTNCPKETLCSVPGCNQKHSKFLHVKDNRTPGFSAEQNPTVDVNGTQVDNNYFNSSSGVYLPTVKVVVDGMFEVFALLDSGSTNTFVTERLMSKLNKQTSSTSYKMNTLSGTQNISTQLVSNLKVSSLDGDHSTSLNNVLVWPSIPAGHPSCEINLKDFPHLSDIPLHPVGGEFCVELLIGMDHAEVLMPLEVRCGPVHGQPYATRSMFGWSLNGPFPGPHSQQSVTANFVNLERLDQQVENLWKLEAHDVDDNVCLSQEDQFVLALWNREVRHVDGHYELPVPWKNGRPDFPCNKYMASVRLDSLLRKLERNQAIDKYSENIEKLVSDGYAECVPTDCVPESGSVWYIPHHGVTSESKPGKLRIVFDCAAKQAGVSLNSECLQGPDENNKLLHVLLRFRQYEYAIMADVRAMYHQVKIPEMDRDCLRFLWRVGGQNVEYRMTCHLFGGKWCSSSSTFALRRCVEDTEVSQLVQDTVCRSFYVDDMLQSVRTLEEATEVIHGTKHALQFGGFELTKYVVNHPSLLESICEDDRAEEVKVISQEMIGKALGIKWNVSDDTFYYITRTHEAPACVTRRKVLSQVSSMYDPLGLICPVVFTGKLLFQEATRLKMAWDDELPFQISHRWSQWLSSLSDLPNVTFPRCIIPRGFEDGYIELHVFCDASQRGYGACAYIRIINHLGHIHVALVAAKARLSPIKELSIPRLELLAAVVAVKLSSLINKELDVPIQQTVLWTDSQIVLAYIQNETRRFKTFVANRVAIIHSSSSPDQWKHVAGHDNPADILTRGCSPALLQGVWIEGPQFLSTPKSDWQVVDVQHHTDLLDGDQEVKAEQVVGSIPGVFCTESEQQMSHPLDLLMRHYSSFYKMKKALCWLLRLKHHLRGLPRVNGYITVQEMREAEGLFLKHVQAHSYSVEIKALCEGRCVAKSSPIRSLNPKLVDGLVVVGGRVSRLTSPVILPHDHILSQRVILEWHNIAHLGTEWLLSLIREKFWITRARRLIQKVKRNCVTCQRLYAQPMLQMMSNLPPERCTPHEPPFTYTGLDLFGPFYIKVGRSEVKRYGCIFTCFGTRAVHIEVLSSLESDTFINGFFRFIARRGCPKTIWSDNGTNLVGAQSELSKSLRQLDRAKVVSAARQRMVEWIFHPPLSSHQGGVWERQIRTIRKVLVAIINSMVRMTDDILHTFLCITEGIINSRPITKVSSDVMDETALSPNHLLLMRGNDVLPWGDFHDSDVYRKRRRQVQHMAD